MPEWAQELMERQQGGAVVPWLLNGVNTFIRENGLGDDPAGRKLVLTFAKHLRQVASQTQATDVEPSLPPLRSLDRASRRLLTVEDQARDEVTAAALDRRAAAVPGLATFRERHGLPVRRAGRSERAVWEAVVRFLQVLTPEIHEELEGLVLALTQAFPWSAEQSRWFVIGGTVPVPPPVRVRFGRAITLEVQPWASPDSVRGVYADAQRRMRGQRYRLRAPPRGYAWVRVNGGFALVSVVDGRIFDVIPD